ncbi:hypothetical protein [Kribbella antibiotica]|uniref:hypothetical protein n=1 Tax=Kribbella antibiotica TaxID=190195 RepID=UPI001404DAD8|nr:hypothetical protein [Kribbella antibiotica]
MPTKSPVAADVVAAVRGLLRQGLPVAPGSTVAPLLELHGVAARASDPGDSVSRTAALNGVLRGLLARFPNARYAIPVRALFGLPPAAQGLNLTSRRELAAELAGHEVHHFRKRVEPKLIEMVAAELLTDAERFIRPTLIAPRLPTPAGRESIVPDPFAWEVAEAEVHLARLWAAIYAARAALLTVDRLVSLESGHSEIGRAAVTAAWRWSTARAEALTYTSGFATDQSPDDLVALAGWTPTLTTEQVDRLVAATQGGEATREQFIADLHGETELSTAWNGGFQPPPPTDVEGLIA